MDSTTITIEPALNFLGILNLLGAAQGLLLALALLNSKEDNRTTNRLLAAMTLTISIIVSGAVLLASEYVFVYPHLSRIHHPFVFLAGPLLYLYLRELISNGKSFQKRDFLHFVPFAVCLIYLLPYYLQSRKSKLDVVSSEYIQASLGHWYYVRSSFFIIQFLVYLILIVLTIVQFSRRAKKLNSQHDRATMWELRFFVVASGILWIGAVLRYALDPTGRTNLLVPLGASALVYAMGYLKMTRLKPRPLSEEGERPSAKKYENSTLTPDRAERYVNKLVQCIERRETFHRWRSKSSKPRCNFVHSTASSFSDN
jgi:hypothetical protein